MGIEVGIKWVLRCALKGKLCCVVCTRTMTQCMSLLAPDQGFPNSVKEWGEFLPQWRTEMRNFAERNLIYMEVRTSGGVILNIQTFFKANNNIL